MTIVMGFQCVDGIVMCADSLESDGISKKYVQKIWSYQVGTEWGIATASAGEADLADSFNESLKDVLGSGDFDHGKLMAKLKGAIGQVRISYPDSQLAMLIGIWSVVRPDMCKLYRIMDQSMHLAPVLGTQSIGIGSCLTSFLSSQLYSKTMFVAEALRLGAFCIARAKEHVDGCGGPTSFLSYEAGANHFWHPVFGTPASDLENEFPASELGVKLRDYWKEKYPQSKWEELTGVPGMEPVSVPGPRMVMVAKL